MNQAAASKSRTVRKAKTIGDYNIVRCVLAASSIISSTFII